MRKIGKCKNGNACVYEIINTRTGKVYIGSTTRFDARFKEHKWLLESGRHHSQHLQFSYNKYGSACFEMKVVELITHEVFMIAREQWWIEYHGFENTYNVANIAGGGGRQVVSVYSINPVTGEQLHYVSAKHASIEVLGYSGKSQQIRKAIYNCRRCAGLYWSYTACSTEQIKAKKGQSRKNRKGLNYFAFNRNGELVNSFSTLSEAAEAYGVSPTAVSVSVRSGFRQVCASMLWSSDSMPPTAGQCLVFHNACVVAQTERWHNKRHGIIRQKQKKRPAGNKKAVVQSADNGKIVAVWESLSSAARNVNGAYLSGVSKAANGIYEQHAGYKWEFAKS